jgi:hypothetical protein
MMLTTKSDTQTYLDLQVYMRVIGSRLSLR